MPRALPKRDCGPVPATAGIGLRAPHHEDMLAQLPPVAWLEVHAENYFGGGPHPGVLDRLREHYPLSLHGVGLSLAGSDPLDATHLRCLSEAVERFQPMLVSEHLCWSAAGPLRIPDLLPFPYTLHSLRHVAGRVNQVQNALGRQILLENLSMYLEFNHSTMTEAEFLAELATMTGCGILLDLNNLYVNSRNHGTDMRDYLLTLPAEAVVEIHLAGHSINEGRDFRLLIDSHDSPVPDPVWRLFAETLELLGPRPTLIEWDSNLPTLDFLVEQAHSADTYLAVSRV